MPTCLTSEIFLTPGPVLGLIIKPTESSMRMRYPRQVVVRRLINLTAPIPSARSGWVRQTPVIMASITWLMDRLRKDPSNCIRGGFRQTRGLVNAGLLLGQANHAFSHYA